MATNPSSSSSTQNALTRPVKTVPFKYQAEVIALGEAYRGQAPKVAESYSWTWPTLEALRNAAEFVPILDLTSPSITSLKELKIPEDYVPCDKTITQESDIPQINQRRYGWFLPNEEETKHVEYLKKVANLSVFVSVIMSAVTCFEIPLYPSSLWWLLLCAIITIAKDSNGKLIFPKLTTIRAMIVWAGSETNLIKKCNEFLESDLWNVNVPTLGSVLGKEAATSPKKTAEELFTLIFGESDKKNQVMAEWSRTYEKNIRYAPEFALYLLRSHAKSAANVYSHWGRARQQILDFVGTQEAPAFTPDGISDFHEFTVPGVPMLFWLLADGSYHGQKAGAKQEAGDLWNRQKKWIGSRWEWAGLSIVSSMIVISDYVPLDDLIQSVANNNNYGKIMRNRIAHDFLKFEVTNTGYFLSLKTVMDTVDIPSLLTDLEARYAKFSRDLNAQFMRWSTAYSAPELQAFLIGACAYSKGIEVPNTDFPANFSRKAYDLGKKFCHCYAIHMPSTHILPYYDEAIKLQAEKGMDDYSDDANVRKMQSGASPFGLTGSLPQATTTPGPTNTYPSDTPKL